jgi:hypothetical protein
MKVDALSRIVSYINSEESTKIDKAISLLQRSDIKSEKLLQILETTRYARVVVAVLCKLFDEFDLEFVGRHIALIHSRIMARLENEILPDDEAKLNCIALMYDKDEYDGNEIVLLDSCIDKYRSILSRQHPAITEHLRKYFLSYDGLSYVDLCDLLSHAVPAKEYLELVLEKSSHETDEATRRHYLQIFEFCYTHKICDGNAIADWLEKSLDRYLHETINHKSAQKELLNTLGHLPYRVIRNYFSRLNRSDDLRISKMSLMMTRFQSYCSQWRLNNAG